MDQQPTVSPCRSPDFWFDDGSVVLHVESTQFRVHRSMLSANSEVFRGMFSLPQPTTVGGDLVDGCPVVHLADAAVDWTYVLKAMYSGRHQENFGDSEWPFPVVAAYLRLGQKYEIEHLRVKAVNVLSAAFPSRLEEYNTNEEDIKQLFIPEASLYFDAISLAREVGMHRFLPAAYYTYCEMFALDEVLEGVQRSDGTISILSAEDQKVVMRGWHKLVESQSEDLFWLTLEPGEAESNFFIDCETLASNKCALARRELLCAVLYPLRSNYSMLRDSYSRYDNSTQCEQCIYYCNNAQDLFFKDFWNALPSVFGLPAWDKLLQE